MFIKHGDGKITAIINSEELTDEQKKSANKMLKKQLIKESEQTDINTVDADIITEKSGS